MPNKFDNFYGRKPVIECIKQLLAHKTQTVSMDTEWYDGLVEHLKLRSMDDDLRKLVNHIIQTEASILKTENILIDLEIRDSMHAEKNPVSTAGFHLLNASKNLLTALVTTVIAALIRLILMIPINSPKIDRDSLKMLSTIQIIFDLVAAVIILGCLFTTYSKMKKSGENLSKFSGK